MGVRAKLGSLLGKGFNSSRLKTMVNLAVSRLAVMKNQRQARCSLARSDVLQILNLGKQESALLRVEQVIKEQNVLDVYHLLEVYCILLLERISLIEQEKGCPEEIKEAVSSLVHASTRCANFPELQEIRKILASRYGKEFVARAVELRNNCGVNPKIIQKLSTRMPSLENKMKLLTQIASDNNIELKLDSFHRMHEQESGGVNSRTLEEHDPKRDESPAGAEDFPDSVKSRGNFKDVAHAAQVAFESAAYAPPLDSSSDNGRPTEAPPLVDHASARAQVLDELTSSDDEGDDPRKTEPHFDEIHPPQNRHPNSKRAEKINESPTGHKRSFSSSSSDLDDGDLNKRIEDWTTIENETISSAKETPFDKETGAGSVEPLNILVFSARNTRMASWPYAAKV